jgi:hypothetical protein
MYVTRSSHVAYAFHCMHAHTTCSQDRRNLCFRFWPPGGQTKNQTGLVYMYKVSGQ